MSHKKIKSTGSMAVRLLLAAVLSTFLSYPCSAEGSTMILSCSPDNDLYLVLSRSGISCSRVESPTKAVEAAAIGSAVLILADSYPARTVAIDASVFEVALRKQLSLYIEFPSSLGGLDTGEPRPAHLERIVVSSEAFGQALPMHRILNVNGCTFVPTEADRPLLVAARVAGFDTAVYGLPKATFPVLFETSGGVLVATTALSGFVTGRYAPAADWETVWEWILDRLTSGGQFDLKWDPSVRPAYGPLDRMPRDFERQALRSGADWFVKSRLLLDPVGRTENEAFLASGVETAPPPASVGDGSCGIREGYASEIDFSGTQKQRTPMRADCNAESAMALAVDWAVNRSERSRQIAAKLMDYVYFTSGMHSGPARGNPEHPAYGLIAWGIGNRAWERAFYGDDNARVMLATMAASSCLGTEKYNSSLIRALLANLRTTGPTGFRGDRIDIPDLEARGWRHYRDTARFNPASHFESYLWACNLWAYRQTSYRPFLDSARKGIAATMEVYPEKWRWANGIAQERARILLCLAWLVRIEDTAEHRQWLRTVSRDLLANQQPCGAIREQLGAGESWAGAPRSNESYGTGEAPLIQRNGDPVADMLYTCNFALLGLHEAAAATGDPELSAAEDRLADFLCRIQIRSTELPLLDGGWFRAFDYQRWDYWASSADVGWGPWSIESGWTQAWITTVLGLRVMGTSLWDLTSDVRVDRCFRDEWENLSRNNGDPWTGTAW